MVGSAPQYDKTVKTSNPVALITGASSGIGEVFARRLSEKGYYLILVARRRERLEKLAAELRNTEVLVADLTIDSNLHKVERRIDAEPEMEFLVNNAGFGLQGSFCDAELEAQDRMHRLHIIAIERLTHAALKGMVERLKGNIVNVSSVAGFLSSPYSVSYCATKAWINSFTEALYIELKCIRSPVRVQALCPGFTYTEFHQTMGMDRGVIPRSLWMSAEDVVDTSFRGLEKNRLFVVPGWRYRLFLLLYRRFPQSLKHFIAMRYSRRSQLAGRDHVDPESAGAPRAERHKPAI
jgi:short-subunit dehydrogenase